MRFEIFSDNIIMNISACLFLVLFLFLMFLFGTFILSLFVKKEGSKRLTKQPPISVTIPAYNEEKNILGCLNSVVRSDYDQKKMQIIIIDDQSTDKTLDIITKFKKKHKDMDITLISGTHQGKSKSLNLGVKEAKYELILSIDADVILEKNTIHELVAPLQDKEVGATNSVAIIRNPKRLLEHFQRVEFFMNNLIRVSFSRVFKNSIWFFGAVACYRKQALEKIGFFKTDTLTEDMDICMELYDANYKIITSEKAMISTVACKSIKELFSQRMRWYYGALQTLVKNKLMIKRGKASAPVIFLFVNQFWWTFFAFLFFPFTTYQVWYWFPLASQGHLEMGFYLFRWFTALGPFYVLYMLPVWGLSLLNIFGVMSGIITLIMSISAIKRFRGQITLGTIIALFFYFPYTILLNLIVISGVIKYSLTSKKYFIA